MPEQQLSAQSEQGNFVPFITVSTDDRNGTCWVVVGRDVAVRCYSGSRAIQVMEMLCTSRGIMLPQQTA
jgi:hypothetical protein